MHSVSFRCGFALFTFQHMKSATIIPSFIRFLCETVWRVFCPVRQATMGRKTLLKSRNAKHISRTFSGKSFNVPLCQLWIDKIGWKIRKTSKKFIFEPNSPRWSIPEQMSLYHKFFSTKQFDHFFFEQRRWSNIKKFRASHTNRKKIQTHRWYGSLTKYLYHMKWKWILILFWSLAAVTAVVTAVAAEIEQITDQCVNKSNKLIEQWIYQFVFGQLITSAKFQ